MQENTSHTCKKCGDRNTDLCMVVYEEIPPQVSEEVIIGLEINDDHFDDISFQRREYSFNLEDFNENQEIVGFHISEEEFQEISSHEDISSDAADLEELLPENDHPEIDEEYEVYLDVMDEEFDEGSGEELEEFEELDFLDYLEVDFLEEPFLYGACSEE